MTPRASPTAQITRRRQGREAASAIRVRDRRVGLAPPNSVRFSDDNQRRYVLRSALLMVTPGGSSGRCIAGLHADERGFSLITRIHRMNEPVASIAHRILTRMSRIPRIIASIASPRGRHQHPTRVTEVGVRTSSPQDGIAIDPAPDLDAMDAMTQML